MKKALLLVLLLAALGVGASLALIPGTPEMALIQFKDKRFDAARATYEEQLKSGKLTPDVVNTLVDLYLQVGSIDQAVAVMEQYVASNPADVSARRRLGELYQFAQRPNDYLRNLEEVAKLNPTPESLAELAQIYNYNSDYARQADTLKQLIALEQEGNAQHFVDLANILASRQSKPEAIDALLRLKARHPQAFDFKQEELLVSLLLDEKRIDEAAAEALAWRQITPPPAPEQVARLVNLLHYKGAPNQAAQLLASYDTATIEATPALLEQQVLLMLDAGQENEAYAKLKMLYSAGTLSPELTNRLLFLAIARSDAEVADPLLANLDIRTLNEPQALTLLELAISRGDGAMQKKLAATLGQEDLKENYPVLTAMLAVIDHKPEAEARLAALETIPLTAQQNLQIARLCLRLKAYSCSEKALARLPAPEELADNDIAAIGNLYLELGAYDKGDAFLNKQMKNRTSPLIEEARVKFAAARGEDKRVLAWLEASGKTTSTRTLSDLFFAAKNHKHNALSARIAEYLYAAEQTPDTRSYLASAYVATGEYAKAVSLLRESKHLSDADESNYLVSLTKLARTDANYRRELGAYAGARLNANLPAQRKLALIYALIDAGQIDVALPYVRELALKNGGQWAWLYANELTKQGKHEEARQFWVTLAGQPSTTDTQRRQIAYNLLAGGFRNDAEPIFVRLSANAPAGSDEVRQLLYLWGPRLNADQLDWLAARMANAPASERGIWASYIADYAPAEELIPFAEDRHPETLFAPRVLSAYVAALGKTGQLKEKHEALFRGIQEYGDPALIHAYAEAAEGQGNIRAARDGYQALFALQPNDNQALRKLGLMSFAEADYSASEMYLQEYWNAAAQDDPNNAADAAYTYADLQRRNHRPEAAAEYYQRTIALIDQANLQTPEAYSKKAQSMIALGQGEQGLALFAEAAQRYPADDNLRADWAASLIELKRYDEARGLLAEPMARMAGAATPAQPLPIPNGSLAGGRVLTGGSEAILAVSGSPDDIRQFASNAETLPWVAYTSEGYHQLLIAARPGYVMKLDKDASGQEALAALPVTGASEQSQLRLRYELLAARADLESGHVYAATERLNALMPEYPNDAQLLGFAANAEHYGGNSARAQNLLKVAKGLAPENEDIALLDRDIRRASAPGVVLDHEWVSRDADDQQITTLKGFANANDHVQIGAQVQNNSVEADNIRRADGRIGNFDKSKQRGEINVLWHDENGKRAKAALFANNDTIGGGGYFAFLNPLGESGLNLEYHKSYWEYIEGIFDDATRDRVSLWHTFKPTTRLSFTLEPNLNRYNVKNDDDVATTWGIDARAVYRPFEDRPYLYLAYGLSAEYVMDREFKTDSTGAVYQALPVKTREVHFLSLNTGYEFSDVTYGDLMAGWGYDRFGGNGPMIEGRLTHELTDHIDAQIRAAYGIDTEESNNNVTRVGGYLRYRF